jgi:hypothetical protein
MLIFGAMILLFVFSMLVAPNPSSVTIAGKVLVWSIIAAFLLDRCTAASLSAGAILAGLGLRALISGLLADYSNEPLVFPFIAPSQPQNRQQKTSHQRYSLHTHPPLCCRRSSSSPS